MACTGRMASAGNTASAAARRPNGPPRPSFATGTCIGTWAAKAGTRRQSDTHPARESPFDGATARHYSSGEAAGTGANRTASRWKDSILIRPDIWGARLLSCACPNHPKLPIRSPACRQHHLHRRRCKTVGRFRPAFLAGSAKPPKMDQQQGLGGS